MIAVVNVSDEHIEKAISDSEAHTKGHFEKVIEAAIGGVMKRMNDGFERMLLGQHVLQG